MIQRARMTLVLKKIIIFALVMGITILNRQLIIEELKEAKL